MSRYRRDPNWCDKCDKRAYSSEELAQQDMDSRQMEGRVYTCGKIFHITERKKYYLCEEIVFGTIGHAIEGIRLMGRFPSGDLPNVAPCRRKTHSHLGYTPWHIVPLGKGKLTKARVIQLIYPERVAKKRAKKERGKYRNFNLPIECWDNEGGALYVPWHLKNSEQE